MFSQIDLLNWNGIIIGAAGDLQILATLVEQGAGMRARLRNK
jgi:hypothetical protein